MAGRIAYYGNIVKDGLVLCLDAAKRDSYPGSGTVWSDISGNQLNGTLMSGPTFDSRNYGSINFFNSSCTLGNQQLLQFTDNFTALCWFNCTATQSGRGIGGNAQYLNGGWMLFFPNNVMRLGVVINSTIEQGLTSDTNLVTDTWYYGGVTFIGGVVTIYLNGVSNKTGSGYTITKGTNSFLIGNSAQGGYSSFNGRISLFQIYNRALSAQEILQNYNATKIRYGL